MSAGIVGLSAAWVAACSFSGVPGPSADATASGDAAAGCPYDLDLALGAVCASARNDALSLGGALDTTSGTTAIELESEEVMLAGGEVVRLVYATAITVDGALRVTGAIPLVLVSDGDLVVTAGSSVSVGSVAAGDLALGAASNPSLCEQGGAGSVGVEGPRNPGVTAGGGGGGGFGRLGASGGIGNDSFAGGSGGETSPATILRGGCPGGTGGVHATASGAPGPGGGAVYLVSFAAIDVSGTLDAGGGGGGGGGAIANVAEGGGGGGGSGGMIALEGALVTIRATGVVSANGGGGGQGGENNGAESPGEVGADASASADPAPGGLTGQGNRGGAGGAGALDAVAGEDREDGGGGGGGSVGVIVIFSATTTLDGLLSPAPSP